MSPSIKGGDLSLSKQCTSYRMTSPSKNCGLLNSNSNKSELRLSKVFQSEDLKSRKGELNQFREADEFEESTPSIQNRNEVRGSLFKLLQMQTP